MDVMGQYEEIKFNTVIWLNTVCRNSVICNYDITEITWLDGETPRGNDLQLKGKGTRMLWNWRDMLHMQDGVLYYRWEEEVGPTTQVDSAACDETGSFPDDLNNRIGGHWAKMKTYSKLHMNFYWPFVRRNCRLFAETCTVHHLSERERSQRASLLHYQAGVIGERVHVDILVPFTAKWIR